MSASSSTSDRDTGNVRRREQNSGDREGTPSADGTYGFPQRIILALADMASELSSSPTRRPDSALDISIELGEGMRRASSGDIEYTSSEAANAMQEQAQGVRKLYITATISEARSRPLATEPADEDVKFWQRNGFLANFTVCTAVLTLLLRFLFFYLSYLISLGSYDAAIQANQLAAEASDLALLESCRSHPNNAFIQALEICQHALIKGDLDSWSPYNGMSSRFKDLQIDDEYLIFSDSDYLPIPPQLRGAESPDRFLHAPLLFWTSFIALSMVSLFFSSSR